MCRVVACPSYPTLKAVFRNRKCQRTDTGVSAKWMMQWLKRPLQIKKNIAFRISTTKNQPPQLSNLHSHSSSSSSILYLRLYPKKQISYSNLKPISVGFDPSIPCFFHSPSRRWAWSAPPVATIPTTTARPTTWASKGAVFLRISRRSLMAREILV